MLYRKGFLLTGLNTVGSFRNRCGTLRMAAEVSARWHLEGPVTVPEEQRDRQLTDQPGPLGAQFIQVAFRPCRR